MHAVNNGPSVKKPGGDQKNGNFEDYKAARIPFARTHDSIGCVSGGAHTCDINAIFPDFDADENDPKNYDFVFTDHYLDNIRRALVSVTQLLTRYFVGILCESTLMMLIVSSILLLFGFSASDAFFSGIVVGVLNVIPYVGPWIGFAICAIASVTFTVGSWSVVAVLAIVAGAIATAQMIDNFVLQPMLYSKQVNAHPLEIFIVILIAGHVGGVLGMLLAIPSYNVIRVFAKEFLYNFKLVRELTDNL